eukprot:1845256-Pyramimonas_sp.AAC.1
MAPVVADPPPVPQLSLAALLEGKQGEWELSCGDDLFGLADYVDVEDGDKQEAKRREQELKAKFTELARTMFGELKQKAE